MLNSKLRILILLAVLLAPTTTQAQGLIAYPFLECPKVQVDPKLDAEQLCVWVTYASVNNI